MPSIIHNKDGSKIVKTNCFDCHSKCGALCFVDKDGKLTKVQGNPEDPRSQGRMCPKGRSAVKIMDDPTRVNYPIRRKPGTQRGAGEWERITWDEAMDDIVEHVQRYRKDFGPESVVFAQGTGRGTNQWCSRLGNSIGVNHWVSPSHVCLLPMMMTQFMLTGTFSIFDGADLDNSDCIVSWGANTSWTEGSYTAGPINRLSERNCKLVTIDPCFEHPLAAKSDYFLGIRPGTDLALAMAWIRIIMEEDLYDHDFTKKWTTLPILLDANTTLPIPAAALIEGRGERECVVWDLNTDAPALLENTAVEEANLDPALSWGEHEITLLDGTTVTAITAFDELWHRVEDMTPKHAADICWLNASDIYESCIAYATANAASIIMFQGVEEHTNARLAMHALTILEGMTGNLDVKGGNLCHAFWNDMLGPYLSGMPEDPEYSQQHLLGNHDENAFYPQSHPKGVWNSILTGEPYQVKAYITIQGNPLSWCEQPDTVKKALMAVDFLVVMDYFMSPTAQLADIVLPSTHWTERDYIADEVCQEYHYAMQKAIEPLYERRSDITFMRDLGHRISPEYWPWETDEELFDFQLAPHNITWAQLKDQWCVRLYPWRPKKYEENGFDTPTRKAEFYSLIFLSDGRHEPLIHWEEPAESPYSVDEATAREYPFVLSTGKRYVNYYHSAYRGIPYMRELARQPHFMINKRSADKLGIHEDDWCFLSSPHGSRKVRMRAHVTEGVHPSVIIAPHGWWQGCKELGEPDYPDNEANINCLISDQAYDPDMGIPGMRSSLCRVEKISA